MDSQTAGSSSRPRLSIDVSPHVSALLEYVSDITGESKAAIASAALLNALPDLVARADVLKKRVSELNQAAASRRK